MNLNVFYTTEHGDFEIRKSRFGMLSSYTREGEPLVHGIDFDQLVLDTAFYLRGRAEGFPEPQSKHSGFVGGKL
jgi:hypothetical protein